MSTQPPLSVPDTVVGACSGRPTIGEWEAMLPLLTLDSNGYPHVCLLSRAELDADEERVYAVIASATTIANLRASGRATLVTVDSDAATYTKLDAESTSEDGGWLLVTFTVAAVKRDSIGIPLRPPSYRVEESIAIKEDWARSARLLAASARRPGHRTR